MSEKPVLKLDWCSYRAAKFAVEHWHYSQSMPTPPVVHIGVWESGKFIGCVLFSRGANNNLSKPYGLENIEVCELTRVALDRHSTPVSRIVSIAIKLLKERASGLRLIVSFADPNERHVGVIYQAGGWIYTGATSPSQKYVDQQGRIWHQRQVSATGIKPQYGTLRRVAKIAECDKVPQLGKHRYLYPLDNAMRKQIQPLAKPYPKRAASADGGTPGIQPGGSGSSPTAALSEVQA